MIKIFQALRSLVPDCQFNIEGGVYEGINWLDSRPMPSKQDVEAEIARLQSLEPARIAGENRRQAYINEADPLFFKAQRGEATMEEWQAKIAEIKARFPKEQA